MKSLSTVCVGAVGLIYLKFGKHTFKEFLVAEYCQGAVRASCTLRDGNLGAEDSNMPGRATALPSKV